MNEKKDKIKVVLTRFTDGMLTAVKRALDGEIDAGINSAVDALSELADDTSTNAATGDKTPAPTESPAESDVARSADDAVSDFNERLKRALEILNEKGDK